LPHAEAGNNSAVGIREYGTLPNTEVNNKYKKRHNQENRWKDLTKILD